MLDPLDVDVQQRTLKTLQVHWLTAHSYSFVCAALLKQAGFQVTELHTDGEGALYKYMKRDLMRYSTRVPRTSMCQRLKQRSE